MLTKYTLLCIFLKLCVINAAILVWSNKKVMISPLLPFDDEDLGNLVKKLEVNKVFLFKLALNHRNAIIPRNLKEVIDPYYSSFNPNGNIATSKAVELKISEECNGVDTNKIHQITGSLSNTTDFLCVLDITYPRHKRDVNDPSSTNQAGTTTGKGPVIYIGDITKDKQVQYALLYSTKHLKLEVNNNTYYLGNTKKELIKVDKRFNIIIPLESRGKVTLRFAITWISGYWYIQTARVEIIDDSDETSKYDLITDENIFAPAHFSYHCNGQTTFFEKSSGTKLIIYDLQVQVDAKKERFGDANDCVPFTTAPIWSGLFVTTILGLGLIVALTAIMDIKTMDKFDNSSTRNLGITVMD